MLGLVSGVFFSAMYLTAASTADESGTWPVVTQRLTAFALVAGAGLVRRQRIVADLRSTAWSALAGIVGAMGVAAVIYGGQRYPWAPVIVASSMYTPVAVGLAWVFLHQHLSRRQILGLVGAVLGVVLIGVD